MLKILITSYTILLSFFVEHWIGVVGFPCYEVSTFGRVRNVITQNLLSPKYDKDGYQSLGIYNSNGKRKFFQVHRLVAFAFIPNPNNLPEVNHFDFQKDNNFYLNLEWSTRLLNMQHYYKSKRDDQYGHASKVA
ncbi:MAG: NUMOD4 domain-containing protein [Bacteriovoracaceae bacterium]